MFRYLLSILPSLLSSERASTVHSASDSYSRSTHSQNYRFQLQNQYFIEYYINLYCFGYSDCSAVKPFKAVQFVRTILVCFMPPLTSRRHCASNSATSRNKDALHVLSHQIFKYTYSFTYLYTLNESENWHSYIFYYMISCHIAYNELIEEY